MTVWYIKPEIGTDANCSAGNGDSAATARYTISNIIAAQLAPGDEIRYVESPSAVSLAVNGTWTSRPVSASVNILSSTNASPIVVTTSSAHGRVTGDTVLVANHATNTNANGVWTVGTYTSTTMQLLNADGTNSTGNGTGGATGTVTDITRSVVTLASAVTKNIACYGGRGALGNWTASANVTCAANVANYKEGGECQTITIASGFTTGLAAYFPLGSAQDFSSYQKVCFWVWQSAGTLVSSGQLQLQLCSDAAGATPVDTINFGVTVLNVWHPITVDLGGALGSSIQSIRVNVVTDVGAQTIHLSNIFATNALTLDVGIGKSTGNYLHAQSINGTRIILDGPTSLGPLVTSFSMGYHGASSTETVYLQSMFHYPTATGTTTSPQILQDTGSGGTKITITGGWNASDMTSQTGKTWFDGRNGRGYGFVISSRTDIEMSDKTIAFCRYYRGISMTTNTDCNIQAWALNHNDSVGLNTGLEKGCTLGAEYCENNMSGLYAGYGCTWVSAHCNGNNQYNIQPTDGCKVVLGECNSAFTLGNIYLNGVNDVRIYAIDISSGKNAGISITNCNDIHIYGADLSNNLSSDVLLTTMGQANNCTLHNCTFGATTPVVSGPAVDYGSFGGVAILATNNDNIDDRYYSTNGNIFTEQSTLSFNELWPKAYRMYVTSTTNVRAMNPFMFSLGKVKLKAGNNQISVQAKRSNTGLEGGILLYGGSAPGIASNVSDSITAAADTFDTLVLSVAPTIDCEVEIFMWAYGGTTYNMLVDDLQVKRGSFSGNITETMAITDWVIRAINAIDNSLAGYAESTGTTYSINVNTDDDCWLNIAPKIHTRWEASRVNSLDDYCVAVDTDATPYLFKCTTAGTSHATIEPTWNTVISGTTADNTTTWTCISMIPDAASLLIGPKIPTVL